VEEEVKPTIKGRLILNSSEDKAWLFLLMRNFRDAIEYAHSLLRDGMKDAEIVKLLTSRILNNAHYSYSAVQRAKLYQLQPYLKLKKPQLFSVGKGSERGNRNIRFESSDIVKIKIPSSTGRHRWIVAKAKFGEKYIPIIEELAKSLLPYSVGIYLKGEKIEIHVNIPLELYVRHLGHNIRNNKHSEYIAGFDFNPDRINMVIVDSEGNILDIKNRHFHEVASSGFPKEKAEDIRRKALAELVEYAYRHGVTDYIAEKLAKPRSKTHSKTANRKITRFALRQYINHLKTLIPRYNGKLHLINPAYSSIDAIPLAKKLGLDIHTTSAYLLVIRYLKSINAYQRL